MAVMSTTSVSGQDRRQMPQSSSTINVEGTMKYRIERELSTSIARPSTGAPAMQKYSRFIPSSASIVSMIASIDALFWVTPCSVSTTTAQLVRPSRPTNEPRSRESAFFRLNSRGSSWSCRTMSYPVST